MKIHFLLVTLKVGPKRSISHYLNAINKVIVTIVAKFMIIWKTSRASSEEQSQQNHFQEENKAGTGT